ncbi:MAG: 2-hydroxychromene-2-carboxylate isomerase [Pseudomonadota bacterium]
MVQIDYYISLNSPWTFLAGARFHELVKAHGASVTTKPAKFADVFAATGGLPLQKRSAARQAYRMQELKRWRKELDVPMLLEPENFPSDETPGARLVIAAELAGLDAVRLAYEIGHELWVRDHAIAEESVLKTAVTRAGIDYDDLTSNSPEDATLVEIWDQNTQDAIEAGVFGAPSFVFEDGEVLWGQDRLQFVEGRLAAS